MVKNVNDKIKKLRPSQRKKVQARAKELIAEKLFSQILKEVKVAQRRMERSLNSTIASCEASNARIEQFAKRVSGRYDDGLAQSIGTRSNLQASKVLLSRVMKITGHRSRRAVIDEALRMLIRINRQAAVRKLKGRIHFDTDKGSGHEKTRGPSRARRGESGEQ